MREKPEQETNKFLKKGTYGDYSTVNVKDLGLDVEVAIANSLEAGREIDSNAEIQFEIVIGAASVIEQSNVRVHQPGEHGFNVNFIPSAELIRLLVEYWQSREK
jgi:hypothetical protein